MYHLNECHMDFCTIILRGKQKGMNEMLGIETEVNTPYRPKNNNVTLPGLVCKSFHCAVGETCSFGLFLWDRNLLPRWIQIDVDE